MATEVTTTTCTWKANRPTPVSTGMETVLDIDADAEMPARQLSTMSRVLSTADGDILVANPHTPTLPATGGPRTPKFSKSQEDRILGETPLSPSALGHPHNHPLKVAARNEELHLPNGGYCNSEVIDPRSPVLRVRTCSADTIEVDALAEPTAVLMGAQVTIVPTPPPKIVTSRQPQMSAIQKI